MEKSEAFLVVETGPDKDHIIPLGGRVTTFGRHSDNDVVVDEVGVSREHAEIRETEAGYYLVDVSSNGTLVNGGDIDEGVHLLTDGDRVRFGPSEVSFRFRSQAADTMHIDIADIKSALDQKDSA